MAMLFVVIERGGRGKDSQPWLATSDPELVRRVLDVLKEAMDTAYEEHRVDWGATAFLDALSWNDEKDREGGEP